MRWILAWLFSLIGINLFRIEIGEVISFRLLNVETGEAIIDPIANNMIIDLSNLPTQLITVEAISNGKRIGSLQFDYGITQKFHVEDNAPYTLCGRINDEFLPCVALVQGMHKIVVTPFSLEGASGSQGKPTSITFNMEYASPVASPANIPLQNPFASPVSSPIKLDLPVLSPVHVPLLSPNQPIPPRISPILSPVVTPVQLSVPMSINSSPFTSPVSSPMKLNTPGAMPVQSPIQSPSKGVPPRTSPIASPLTLMQPSAPLNKPVLSPLSVPVIRIPPINVRSCQLPKVLIYFIQRRIHFSLFVIILTYNPFLIDFLNCGIAR
jgi:hypothetical protein